MNSLAINDTEIKVTQQRNWNAVSSGWDKWWEVLEQGGHHVTERLLDIADVQAGQRVLDVATGIGEPALSAARRVGPDGHIIAIDQASEMLEIAQKRATNQALSNLTFQLMDGEALDQVSGMFDSVLCRWGLMFFPNPLIALQNMHRLLIQQGKLAVAVWSTPDKVPSISLSMQVACDLLQEPPPPPELPNPFRLADTDRLVTYFEQAGFENIAYEKMNVSFDMPSAETYTAFTQDVSAPLQAMLSKYPPALQMEVWDAITRTAANYADSSGAIRMDNECICIAAKAL